MTLTQQIEIARRAFIACDPLNVAEYDAKLKELRRLQAIAKVLK